MAHIFCKKSVIKSCPDHITCAYNEGEKVIIDSIDYPGKASGSYLNPVHDSWACWHGRDVDGAHIFEDKEIESLHIDIDELKDFGLSLEVLKNILISFRPFEIVIEKENQIITRLERGTFP